MIIDVHNHVLSPEVIAGARHYMTRDAHFKTLGESPKNKYATADDLVAEIGATGVDQAVAFGFAFKDQGLCRETNDYVIDAVRRYPGRLIGFACVSPLAPGLEAELTRCHEAGLVGVGELFPDGQGYDISDQAQVGLLAGVCRERGMPILLHTNEQVGHAYPGKGVTGPVRAAAFAEHNPGVTVILAHLGGGLLFYELMPEMRRILRDVYYDTAAMPFLYDKALLQAAATAGVLEKVLFGSDYPLLSPGRYVEEIDRVGLDSSQKALILGANAARVIPTATGR
ncbi:MAG TPA: amidohydrolase family protein [Bacillota bacterium]|jgi:hypothetical protein